MFYAQTGKQTDNGNNHRSSSLSRGTKFCHKNTRVRDPNEHRFDKNAGCDRQTDIKRTDGRLGYI